MRRLFLILLGTFSLLIGRSQNNKPDSLLHSLSSAKEDTNKVHALLQLSNEYKDFKPDSALLYARQALKLSRKLKFKSGEAKSLSGLALSYLYANNRNKALENFLKAMKIYEDLNDKSGI